MNDTIAAISTAVSPSGIGIIRISGSDALEIISKIYRSPGGKKNLKNEPTHTIHYGYIYDEQEAVDEVLVMLMRAPKTFTGEDTIEIDCHGGVLAMQRILQTVLKNGAVLAQPGEFSKRAFLNGRMDLSQAEAVMDLIQAKNNVSMRNSVLQLKGSLHKKITDLRERILYEMAYIEAALDDPEHFSLDGYADELLEKVTVVKSEVNALRQTASQGHFIQEGVSTVILGKPNAGKSSLLNALLGEERAIVTDVAGTTRDTLEEYINLGPVTLHLIDTAGIHHTEDYVEKIGIEKAKERAEKADLILYVADSSSSFDEDDKEILSMLKDKKTIILYNKTDLKAVMDIGDLSGFGAHRILPVSILEGKGIHELEIEIQNMLFHGNLDMHEDVIITNERHRQLLITCENAAGQVIQSIKDGLPEDFFTIDLMTMYQSLGEIIGEEVEDDLVQEIFSRFCMGK